MDLDCIEGQGEQERENNSYRWGTIMNDEVAVQAANRKKCAGSLRMNRDFAQEESKGRIEEIKKILDQLKKSIGEARKFQNSTGLTTKKAPLKKAHTKK